MEQKSYQEQLHEKLQAARTRVKQGNEVKALKASAPTLFEIMDTEITLAVSKMTSDKPVSHDEYLSLHGQVRGIMRVRDLLNSKEVEAPQAQAEAIAIEENIKQIKNDEKKQ